MSSIRAGILTGLLYITMYAAIVLFFYFIGRGLM